MRLLVFLFFSALAAVAQQSATTTAPCSPIAPDNSGSITINCPGISKEQGQKMLVILNRILANQIDPEVVMVKLDEIQHGVSSIETELANKKRKEDELERKRRTAPLITVSLTPLGPGKVNLCVISDNMIPFQYIYTVTNSKSTIIGGFPLAFETFYPSDEKRFFCLSKNIDVNALSDHLIVLNFRFKSLSFDELQLPGHAGGEQISYSISDDGKFTIQSSKPI